MNTSYTKFDFIKEMLAIDIANFLLENGLIKFTEEEIDKFIVFRSYLELA